MRRTLFLLACTLIVAVCFAEKHQGEKANSDTNVNSLCGVCHLDLQTEKIATVHLAEGITCDKCHGDSTNHMHDEMLMTKPDLLFGRMEVEQMCSNCHQSHSNPEKVETFRRKWLGRARPNGRTITAQAVCTDCHGTHNIVRQARAPSDKETADQWTPLFNGENLDNWSSSTNFWAVKRHSIIGVLAAPAKAADIWTQATYDNYLLSVTFRTTGLVRAGIWLKDQNGPRVEIFNQSSPPASPASVYLPGKGLVLVNHTSELFDDSGWNTISVKVHGNLVQVWLNAEQIGAVRTKGRQKGRVGLHIEKSPAAEPAQFEVREILIKQISENRQDN